MLNVLTNRKRAPPQSEDIEKSNISSDTKYSNSNAILLEMSEMQPIRGVERYANMLRRPVEAVKKAWVFTKDNQQR